MTRPFRGTYTVMIPPGDAARGVDLPALAAFTEWQVAQGIHGLIPLGSTGEFLSLSEEERVAVAETVIRTAAGRVPVLVGTGAEDTREAVRERIAEGRRADLLVFSGGVSMGEYDLVEEALGDAGAEFHFTGVKMQPGKPVVFGRLPARQNHPLGTPEPECYFFGLPGNPISTQVTFHCFVETFVRALGGEAGSGPRWAQATLVEDVADKPGITRLLPARMDAIQVRIVGWQGSGDLAANARANCYAELQPGQAYRVGDVVRVLLR